MTAGPTKHLGAPPSMPPPQRPARRLSQRTLAGVVGLPLLVVVWVGGLALPVPVVTYTPGLTVDVLGKRDGKDIIQVTGHRTYRDDGALEMTTIYATPPGARVNLFEAMKAWLSRTEAVYPYDSIYPPETTRADNDRESAVQMVSSQDAAVAVALDQLGYDVTPVVEVQNVAEDMPANGHLQVRDVIRSVSGTRVTTSQDVVDAVLKTPEGQAVTFVVRRGGKDLTVRITPEQTKDGPKVGIVAGPGYDFPFKVEIDIDPDIGGPSAGLMFSLGIYDTLTPGSLTDGKTVAGTGTINELGEVGPIGGIQQKIVAADRAGAQLFFVPKDNCDEVADVPHGDMRLVRATTMPEALKSLESWVEDPDATLPTCSASASDPGKEPS